MSNIIQQNYDDINSFEKAAIKRANLGMQKDIEELEEFLFENKSDNLEVISRKARTISTKVGDITFKRRLYFDHDTDEYVFLLDEALKIRERKRASGEFLKLLVILASMMTYRQVEEVLEVAGFPVLSHTTIFNEVRAFGERESEKIKAEKEELYSRGQLKPSKQKEVPILFVELDGVMISSQEEESNNFEVKMGLCHEGWKYSSPAKTRKQLINPKILTGVYDSTEDFYEEFSCYINSKYNLDGTKIVLNGDGARWIQETSYDYFGNLTVQLDRFHIKKDITLHFGKQIAEDLTKVLARGRKKLFLDTLESLIYDGDNGETIEGRETLFKHYKKYESHLLDYRHRIKIKDDYPELHGMGAIESYIGKIIARRMKNQGMSWKRLGAEAMVKILMLRHNRILKVRLDDQYYKIKNPVKELKYRKRVFKRNWSDWLQASMPVIYGPCSGQDWVKGIKAIATV